MKFKFASLLIIFILTGCVSPPKYTISKTREEALKTEEWRRAQVRPANNSEETKKIFTNSFKANGLYNFYTGTASARADGQYYKMGLGGVGELVAMLAKSTPLLGAGFFTQVINPGGGYDLSKKQIQDTSHALNYPNTSLIKIVKLDGKPDFLAASNEISSVMLSMHRNCNPVMPPDDQNVYDIWFYFKQGEILQEAYICDSPLEYGDLDLQPDWLSMLLNGRKAYQVITKATVVRTNDDINLVLTISPLCGIRQLFQNKSAWVNSRIQEDGRIKGEYIKLPNYSTEACLLEPTWGNEFLSSGWVRLDRSWPEKDPSPHDAGVILVTDVNGTKAVTGPFNYITNYTDWRKAGSPRFYPTHDAR